MATKYIAKKPDSKGYVAYDEQENETWHTLITRQLPIVKNRACEEFIQGLEILDLPKDSVPQLPDVNKKLLAATGWQVVPVPTLINFDNFFNLLANRKFPAATFIRIPEELDYLQEPDIFHEIFGHCPMLTNKPLADFTAKFGELGLNAPAKVQKFLARLYWFTIEFGLIKRNNDLKIYGGGILSSIGETTYALDSEQPVRQPFDLINMLRTPYRIDIFQTTYFVINDFHDLLSLFENDLTAKVKEAIALGEFDPSFPPKIC